MIKQNRLILFLTTIAVCNACVYTPVTLPKLPDVQKQIECQKIEPVICPRLDMPEPIPANAVIEIVGGKAVKIDAGGEKLIRSYAATRKAIKSLWLD